VRAELLALRLAGTKWRRTTCAHSRALDHIGAFGLLLCCCRYATGTRNRCRGVRNRARLRLRFPKFQQGQLWVAWRSGADRSSRPPRIESVGRLRDESETRRVLKAVFTERIEFAPFNEGATRSYQFVGPGSYGEVLLSDTCPTSNGGPNGIRTRVYSPPRAFVSNSAGYRSLTKHPFLRD
jgi:hypothetical protein